MLASSSDDAPLVFLNTTVAMEEMFSPKTSSNKDLTK